MTIVLNRDNPVEALRAVALPWALGGDLDFQFWSCETLLKSLCAGGKTKTEKEKAGIPASPLLRRWIASYFFSICSFKCFAQASAVVF